jgi:LPS-assembly protein
MALAVLSAVWSASAALAQQAPAVALKPERQLGAGRSAVAAERDAVPAYISAERISGEIDERVMLEGRGEIRKGGMVVRGDRVEYVTRTDELTATGNARVFSDGLAFFGPSLTLKLEAQTGRMPEASYTYGPRRGRGESSLTELLGEGRARLSNATYTTCTPADQAWWVRAERIDIDREDEVARARNARLYFLDVPILASPYFQFPLGDKRRSGLLTPTFGINSRLGPEVTVPLYWNIAPNRDATISSRVMARRGVLLQNEFRYLEPSFRGTLEYDGIEKDRDRGESRERFSLRHEHAFPNVLGGSLGAGLNYNRVSDDKFFSDFSSNIVSASQTVLPRDAALSYGRGVWNSALRWSTYQTLTSLLAGQPAPYQRVPQFTLGSAVSDWRGFDLALATEAVRFEQGGRDPGTRVVVNPSVAYPIQAPGWFIVPKFQYHATDYTVESFTQRSQNGVPSIAPSNPAAYQCSPIDAQADPNTLNCVPGDASPSRRVPIGSLDAGLIFERDAKWFGDAVTQTLEPRLYYSYIPLRQQNALPNFDSALADFNFAQLFTENVFAGSDRIAEANQATAALLGRVLEFDTGAERLRVALGQRYFFSQQRVALPDGSGVRTDKESDLLASVSGALDRAWRADVSVQHSTLQNQIVRATVGVRYQPRPASVLSLAYRYKIDDIDQIDVATQWPLAFMGLPRWYGVARVNYSQRDSRVVESLGGLEYKADCWVLRLAAQRFLTADRQPTTSFFLQLELNDLSSVGSSPVETLRRNIPGYQLINPPPREPGRFDYYE